MISLSLALMTLCSLVIANPLLSPSRTEGGLVRRQSRPTSYAAHTFDQPIDHFPDDSKYEPHAKGTFKQRYYFDDSYYKPGGPVFLYIGGETSGPSRFSNLENGIIQIWMSQFNGLGVILENRYYGESFPFNTSSTDDLAYLTTEQTIADNAYFAQHAVFPGVSGNLTAPSTAWLTYGGSLAGGESAFTVVKYGGSGEKIIYGGVAASGVVKTSHAYPEWYDPIQKFGPQDCVASINAIVDKMDMLIAANNTAGIQQLKEIFGLGALSDIRDFAMTIGFPLGGPDNYPLSTWQELNWNTSYSDPQFWYFCGNVTNQSPPSNNTAVDYALSNYTNGEPWVNLGNYAAFFKSNYLPLCTTGRINSTDTGCFSTQNQSYWADTTNGAGRSYTYTTCTEIGVYQVGQNMGKPSLVSRVLTVDYTQQWCNWAFPPGQYNTISTTGPNVTAFNGYGGYNIKAPRLAFIDGSSDVWLDVTYHSNLGPERYPSTGYLHPEYLINGAGHHWDSYGILDVEAEPQFIRAAHEWEIRIVDAWLANFTSDWYMQ